MNDLTSIETGKAIVDHWHLLLVIAAVLFGLFSIIFGLMRFIRWSRSMLHEEIQSLVGVLLDNGIGQRVHEIVEAAVIKAMKDHTIECPMKERMNAQHERILTVERAILKAKDE